MYIFAAGAAGFVLFGIWNYFVTDKIGALLARNFPDVYGQICSDSWPTKLRSKGAALSKFAWKRRDKGLGDRRITRLAVLSIYLTCLTMLSWGVAGVGVFAMIHADKDFAGTLPMLADTPENK